MIFWRNLKMQEAGGYTTWQWIQSRNPTNKNVSSPFIGWSICKQMPDYDGADWQMLWPPALQVPWRWYHPHFRVVGNFYLKFAIEQLTG